ncbi:peptidase T [Bacteroidetes oral taxon 274 str. F0058]|nr:peptidase T [Bacteroidetes oral taxon 274 str. F0058]
MNLLERFLKYVSIHTTSDENTGLVPSTPQQMEFAKILAEELKAMGMQDISLDKKGYLMATLPSNIDKDVPTVGFISHLDTSPDMSGKNVKPRIVENYDGNDIVLNEKENIVLSPKQFPELTMYRGQSLVVTNGLTLLGADDKAGIAEIMTAMDYFIKNPDVKHGKVRIAFNPDEEIGLGAHHFDVEKFGCQFAYTMDGGEIGELEYENFNAAGAKVTFYGTNVHPGYAKNKMVNSMKIATKFMATVPANESPEYTDGYEGFYHLTGIGGDVEKTTVSYIIRDHDRKKFEERKAHLQMLVDKINSEFGDNTATLEVKDQYYNMKEKVEPVKYIVDIASEAIRQAGVEPKVKPIRGGTDGAQLSFKGLPCPNIFAGGHNFHGKYEFVPIQSMEKATEVIKNIIKIVANR